MVQAPKELPPIGGVAGAAAPVAGTNLEMRSGIANPQPRSQPLQPPMISKPQQSQRPAEPSPSKALPQSQSFIPLNPPKPVKEFHLPKIDLPAAKEKPTMRQHAPVHDEELKRFEEAINKINIDIIHTEPSGKQPRPAKQAASALKAQESYGEEESYYHPKDSGEGYFSEIEHYIKHKDVNEIIDDVLKKDFLTDMKDYHDSKAGARQFFLHKQDLKDKLQKKMEALRCLEEEWHGLKVSIEEEVKLQKELEAQIDSQSSELKDLFRQVRHTQWLEQEAPQEEAFRLTSGQELKSLNELRKALSYITDEEFSHHVNAEKNDFASWARNTLKNAELADKISQARTKEELQAILQSPA